MRGMANLIAVMITLTCLLLSVVHVTGLSWKIIFLPSIVNGMLIALFVGIVVNLFMVVLSLTMKACRTVKPIIMPNEDHCVQAATNLLQVDALLQCSESSILSTLCVPSA